MIKHPLCYDGGIDRWSKNEIMKSVNGSFRYSKIPDNEHLEYMCRVFLEKLFLDLGSTKSKNS